MNYEQLKQLIEQVDQSSLREFELTHSDVQVRMSKNENNLPAGSLEKQPVSSSVESVKEAEQATKASFTPKQKEEAAELDEVNLELDGYAIKSPIVGIIYLSPAPDEPPFKQPGDRVKKGETLCIVEAMKVMNEIKSDADGVLVRCIVEDNQPVEYDQPLFILNTEE